MSAGPASGARRTAIVLSGMLLAALAALAFAAAVGSVSIPLADMPHALGQLLNGGERDLYATLLDLRLSRAVTAFVTGAALSLAGVMMQALLRNPLADPYVLGLSGGASAGALCAMLFVSSLWIVDAAAFGGAVAVSMLLYLLARRDFASLGGGSASLLLLTGVILSAGCMAVVTLMLSVVPENRLQGMVFWMIGDLAGAQLHWFPFLVLGIVLLVGTRMGRTLNVLAMHAETAATLGIPVAAVRRTLFFGSGLLTASAVTSAGAIGFVGLIVPHACRIALGPDHRLLLPAATLAGGTFLVLADTLARTVLAPQQLPVGVVTALIGVPVFLFQLHRLRRA
ncbi:MAG TPA: iron ABC transporter permease [Burkholderiaceae bacterium]